MESNPTLYPPQAESQSCISCDITLRPAAALFPAAREPSGSEGPDCTALSLTGTLSHQHYHAFISSPAARHGRPPLGPPGYFTNNLFLISHCAPLPVIKEPINGAGKGEAFK